MKLRPCCLQRSLSLRLLLSLNHCLPLAVLEKERKEWKKVKGDEKSDNGKPEGWEGGEKREGGQKKDNPKGSIIPHPTPPRRNTLHPLSRQSLGPTKQKSLSVFLSSPLPSAAPHPTPPPTPLTGPHGHRYGPIKHIMSRSLRGDNTKGCELGGIGGRPDPFLHPHTPSPFS